MNDLIVRKSAFMIIRSLIAVAVFVSLLATGALAQQPVFPGGARVGLVPPAGFALAKSFVGFEDESRGGAIVIGDLPRATYDEMIPTFTPEGLTKGGINATQPSASWPISGGDGRIMQGTQISRGVTYRRWLVLAKTDDTAAMVSAMIPEESADAATDAVEAALRTIAFRAQPSLEERVAALPFRVGDRAGFRPTEAIAGLSLFLTDGPSDKPTAGRQPVISLIAHASGAQGGPAANAKLARELFAKTPTLRSAVQGKIVEDDETSVIEGVAIDAQSKAEVEVIQIVRFRNGGYMRSVAIWGRGQGSLYRERFERLEASVEAR